MKPLKVFTPADAASSADPAPISEYNIQLLAQGDSWFSLGALPPTDTTNLFDGMGTSTTGACVVNCARPGKHLKLMTDAVDEHEFARFLGKRTGRPWSGILLSGGGNDLIAAINQSPTNIPVNRVLAVSSEWSSTVGVDRYISNAGWMQFSDHMVAVFRKLLELVNRRPENRTIPIVMHNYDIAVPRDSGPGLGLPAWLYPAMQTYQIPAPDRPALAATLMRRLDTLLQHIADTTAERPVHLVKTHGTLTSALPSDAGPTVDWQNEIHPSKIGYRKLAAKWNPVLDAVFGS